MEQRKRRAAKIIKRIAREHHVTEAEVRKEMKEAMDIARRNSDPAVQARWQEFHFEGAEPTVEEFIIWLGEQLMF